ncbi:hypothetical protein IEO21_10861 [Rhodonia placenta]|uniref:Uncharacterized protein n=1 Tax=Rhodonia placenta TaxID=104341 RepID=A0A8H7NRN2_9APHY|nr:hypothetical protein IEO21_10861 [Postia placenta]
MLTRPRGLVSQSGCVSGAWAVPCIPALQWAVLVLTDAWLRFLLHTSQKQYWAPPRAPPLPPPTVADEFFDCSRLEHTFDTQEQIDVSPVIDNCALITLHNPSLPKKGATCRSDESSILHSGMLALRDSHLATSLPSHPDLPPQAPAFPNLSPVQSTATPQVIPQPSLGLRLERNPKPEPSDSPVVTWASSSSAISSSTPVPVARHPASGLPPSPPPPSPPRGRSSTRSSRGSPGRQSQQPSPPVGSPPSPSSPVMSSPASPPDKKTLKHLLPLRYDGKTVIECNHFISQLFIYLSRVGTASSRFLIFSFPRARTRDLCTIRSALERTSLAGTSRCHRLD